MPVDREHSRFAPRGGLGIASIWKCPACGKQNEGRTPEMGCAHCGSGDPGKSQAGSTQELSKGLMAARAGEQSLPHGQPPSPSSSPMMHPPGARGSASAGSSSTAPTRILRLIEYLIPPGVDASEVLQRSLVGSLDLTQCRITGTLVDDVSARQEDLLTMARRQPGVWLANPTAMQALQKRMKSDAREVLYGHPLVRQGSDPGLQQHRMAVEKERLMEPEIPDTGPAFSETEASLAHAVAQSFGLRWANTMALALSSIAPELAGNSEPEKFLSDQECLAFAQALLAQIPEGWVGDLAEEPPALPDDAAREAARARAAEVAAGAQPTAIPWVDPTTRKPVL